MSPPWTSLGRLARGGVQSFPARMPVDLPARRPPHGRRAMTCRRSDLELGDQLAHVEPADRELFDGEALDPALPDAQLPDGHPADRHRADRQRPDARERDRRRDPGGRAPAARSGVRHRS